MTEFLGIDPTLEDYWRAIILFGKNVACYKFALGKALLELAPAGKSIITLDELAEPYSRYVTEHLHLCDTQSQTTQNPYPFLEACQKFNQGEISKDELIQVTNKEGFKVVFNKFHNLKIGETPVRFYHKQRGALTLTDDLFELIETGQLQNLTQEIEARWRVVETSWKLGISRNVIAVDYDNRQKLLFTKNRNCRINLTSCRNFLNGYQKSKCFYYYQPISVISGTKNLGEVEHFFPLTLGQRGLDRPLNEIWNLVLSCESCNRGKNGKSDRLAHPRYLARLYDRNEFLIGSYHLLRADLMFRTGSIKDARQSFLQTIYNEAQRILVTSVSRAWNTIEYDTDF
jgi:5-methylcytosine-specific restriction endonuclease McrA